MKPIPLWVFRILNAILIAGGIVSVTYALNARADDVYTDTTAIIWPGMNKDKVQFYDIEVNGEIVHSMPVDAPREAVIATTVIGATYVVRIIGRYLDGSVIPGERRGFRRTHNADVNKDGIVAIADFGKVVEDVGKCNLNGEHQIPCPPPRSATSLKCDPEGLALLGNDLGEFAFCL